MTPAAPGPASPLDDLLRGIWRENPVFVQVLGMCPTLAVSNSALNALTMGLATTFVLCLSSVLISLLRHAVPREVRIASFVLVIATFVTVVDYLIQAISLAAARGARRLHFADRGQLHHPRPRRGLRRSATARCAPFSTASAWGWASRSRCSASAPCASCWAAAACSGSACSAADFEPWTVMILPSGGFFTLGAWLLAIAWWRRRRDAAALAQEAS